MIVFFLCLILCYIQYFKIITSDFLVSMIISWLVLISTRIFVQFPRGTIER